MKKKQIKDLIIIMLLSLTAVWFLHVDLISYSLRSKEPDLKGVDFFILRQSSKIGNSEAQALLGYILFFYSKDEKTAGLEWIKKAASREVYPPASYYECKLGEDLLYGHGIQSDFTEAVKWLNLGAAKGDICSENMLGKAYLEGKGVSQNTKLAIESFERALNFYEIAKIYDSGTGIPRNPAKAFENYLKVAEHRWPMDSLVLAETSLADYLYRGEDVSKNSLQAYYWILRAKCDAGSNFQPESLYQKIESSLTPDETLRTKSLVKQHIHLAHPNLPPSAENNVYQKCSLL